jgi:truncated hemoglobin YjbI
MAQVIDMREVEAVAKRLTDALDEISDAKERQRINRRAGQFVQYAARAKAPRSNKVHYHYSSGSKIVKSLRAKRGSRSEDRVAYYPGNLQLSIRVFKLKRAISAIIGPRIQRNARAKSYGKNERNVNAFYAQMIYGSAIAFRDRVMTPALKSQEARVKAFIKREIDALKRKAARKNNLD